MESESLSSNRFSTGDSISEDVSSSDADIAGSILSKLSRGELASSVKVLASKLVVGVASTAGKVLPLSVRVDFNLESSDSSRARSLLPGDSGRTSSRSSLDKRSSRSRGSAVVSRFRPGSNRAALGTDSETNRSSTATVLSNIVERNTVGVAVVDSNVEVDISENTVSVALLKLVGSGGSGLVGEVVEVGSPVNIDTVLNLIKSHKRSSHLSNTGVGEGNDR